MLADHSLKQVLLEYKTASVKVLRNFWEREWSCDYFIFSVDRVTLLFRGIPEFTLISYEFRYPTRIYISVVNENFSYYRSLQKKLNGDQVRNKTV